MVALKRCQGGPMAILKKKAPRPQEPLSVETWCKAALNLITREGVQALAVEPMTRALGVTKGSFYWHFENRDALVRETLQRWELDQTRDLFARFGSIEDPRARLRILMFAAFEDIENGLFFAALSSSSEDPRVKPYLQRVSEQRLDYVTESFRALGLPPDEARRKALFAYASYVGYFHLLRAIPDRVKAVSDLSAYVRDLADSLVPVEKSPLKKQKAR
jgi:AcrR family transcriptional regulator